MFHLSHFSQVTVTLVLQRPVNLNWIVFVFAGCDRKKYQDRRNEMGETHRLKVETLIKKWQDAEKRYNVLKSSDGDQAASSMAG